MPKHQYNVVMFLSLIIVAGFTFVSGQDDSQTGSNCNVTRDAPGCEEEIRHSSFLMQVLIISGSIAGIILLLSVVVCIVHFVNKRKADGIIDIEASSEFHMSEDPQVRFRRLDGGEANRAAASVFSWGSEFSDGDRKGQYENPDVIEGMSRKSRGQIYANTLNVPGETTSPHLQIPVMYTNINQYANLHGDERTSLDDDYMEPLPQ